MSNREPLDHTSAELARAPQAASPSDRVSLDWWQPPSISGTRRLAVVGETHHQAEIAAVACSWPTRNVIAQLLADPSDPHDRHAVMVLLDGFHVGHLPGDRDPRFTGLIRHLAVTQGPVRVRARITGGAGLPWGVTLAADPEPFDPRLDFLSGPRSEPVHCTEEQRRLGDELALLGPLAAQLRVGHAAEPSRSDRVQVVVHRHQVGELGAATSAEYLPLVRTTLERGFVPSCRVEIRWPTEDHSPHMSTLRVSLLRHPADLADVCGADVCG